MVVDGDWVRAEGTTLGADNGIGVASILAVLESSDVPHPALEALFTIDEETGMTGALGLKGGFLTGDILLNLDTEDDDEISIGCAVGSTSPPRARTPLKRPWPTATPHSTVVLRGASGGHSGMDIHKGLGQRQQTHEPRGARSLGSRGFADVRHSRRRPSQRHPAGVPNNPLVFAESDRDALNRPHWPLRRGVERGIRDHRSRPHRWNGATRRCRPCHGRRRPTMRCSWPSRRAPWASTA